MSNYPFALDTDADLYLVHDYLKVTLADDYSPGDTEISVNPSPILAQFPPTGIITLTEQCSDVPLRALSLSYSGVDTANSRFTGLQVLPEFTDVAKPAVYTSVTLNIFSRHHNALKDALLNMERFVGLRTDVSRAPLVGSMTGRIAFLRNLVLPPRAWFTVSLTTGTVPLTVQFQDASTRAPNQYIWDFGDGNTTTLNFPYVPGQAEGTVLPGPNGTVSHTYTTPGSYNVSLTVINPFGQNSVTIQNLVVARTAAPDPATLAFEPTSLQMVTGNTVRTRANQVVKLAAAATAQPMDPISNYTWNMGDDMTHPNLTTTDAEYGVGGLYDVKLRVGTQLGAYRITTFPAAVDVVERRNLWLTLFDPATPSGAITKNAYTYEYGLVSETFKVSPAGPLSVTQDPTFLTGLPSQSQQQAEFLRNVGFTPRSNVSSGDQGTALLYWSQGGSSPSASQSVAFAEFNGFTGAYTTPSIGGNTTMSRSWNWASLNSPQGIYFLFGSQSGTPANLTNPNTQVLGLQNFTVSGELLTNANFLNGSQELLSNVGGDGFGVYRTCWKDSAGFIARNDGVGPFFRIKSFYRTEGVLGDPVRRFLKLPDIPGATKLEGQLVALTNGVYFFDNTGQVAVFNPLTKVWATGGPGLASPAFTSVQDTTVAGYDDDANTLLATSDGNRHAYLSFDYSPAAFIKFNEVDLSFTKLKPRPTGGQFAMTIY